MKRLFIPLALVMVLVLPSCLKNKAEYTPYISFSHFILNPVYHGDTLVWAEDTLNVTINEDDQFVLDTVEVGDTIVFAVGYGSYANDLQAARILVSDSTGMRYSVLLNEAIRSVLVSEQVDGSGVNLELQSGYNYLAFPAGCKILKSGTHRVEFKVESDSKYSPNSYIFLQPVR